ncbi:chromosome segregation protein SMC [bacterium]|nr:chromosome segregation protein SMC [bacterium]
MLKSLEIYGFKSFADRVRFDFSAGITGVVGPNGSGKSNVVDALKWILGDQSAKSLRGKEMTDVIFNGSSSRKPCTFAEAFLTIDNVEKILPVDDSEVVIGRRLYRSGDAEYLINRQPARLKDVRDLLLGSGAGNAAYCIIEQGRVDQILQTNPAARRNVFDEAAGISRFRVRRVEAQRKLERVAQNLQRLSDIVDEVEARLNSTRGQAAKAVKYRELSTELKTWWLGLSADDYRHRNGELQELDRRLTGIAARLEALSAEQQNFDSHEAAFDLELQQIDQQARGVERRWSLHREELASLEASLKFQSSRLAELDTELQRLRPQQVQLLQREHSIAVEMAEATERLQEVLAAEHALQLQVDSQDELLLAAHEQVQAAQRIVEQRREELTAIVEQRRQVEQNLIAIQAQQAGLAQSQSRLEIQWQDLTAELASAEETRTALLREYEIRQQHVDQLQTVYRERLEVQQSLAGDFERLRRQIAELREARSAAVARRSLLEDLELRQDGLGLGVKELLHRAKHSQDAPWNTILGSVADLLEVDLEHAGLIEVALGTRSQLIVLSKFQPLLDYLAQGLVTLTGRVGFVAIPRQFSELTCPDHWQGSQLLHLLPQASAAVDLSTIPGVVTRADRLIASEHGVTGLAAALLADTWIVRDLATAVELSLKVSTPLRFVTLQGELVDTCGVLQFGTVRSETSLLSRKSELRRIRNDLIRLERELATREADALDLEQKAEAADAALNQQKQQLDAFNDELAEAMAAWKQADQTVDRARREVDQVSGQRQSANAEAERLQEVEQAALANLETVQLGLTTAEMNVQQAEADWTAARDKALGWEQSKSTKRLNLLQHQERVKSTRAELQRLADERQQRKIQRDEGLKRLNEAEQKQSQIVRQILNSRALLSEHYVDSESLQWERQQSQRASDALRQKRAGLVEQEQRLRRERRELQDRQHADEIRARELRQSLETLAERIQEEYQVSLGELAETDMSAWQLWRQSRPGSPHSRSAEEQGGSTADETPDTIPIDPHLISHQEDDRGFTDVRPEIEAHVARVRRKLKLLGSVNTDSLHDLEQLEQRFLQLSTQLQDLVEAKATLEDIIRRMNQESRRMFAETFQTIRKNFQHLFRKVFGGGEGDILLEDPEEMLECGIEITARPPGKELRGLSLLSGGEKTMTAIALIMAIFQAKPSPFCILDEVDAALDEANVDRFANVLREFQNTTQFIMITHHKRSMLVADVLYGVTMEESGVSKRMSVRFDDITDDGNFRRTAAA